MQQLSRYLVSKLSGKLLPLHMSHAPINSISVGALSQTPPRQRSRTTLLQSIAGFKGATSEGIEGKGEEKMGGVFTFAYKSPPMAVNLSTNCTVAL